MAADSSFTSCTIKYAISLLDALPIFTPIIGPTFGGWLLKGYLTDFGCYRLSWCDGRCVQGPGTYSPRHADPRLLAIPASCRRIRSEVHTSELQSRENHVYRLLL